MAGSPVAVSQRERRFGGLSLISVAAAVVGFASTIVPGANVSHRVGGVDPGVVWVGLRIVFLMLAVLFGILGRRSRAGRFALVGSGALLGVFLVATVFLVSRPAPSVARPTTVQFSK